MSPRSIRLFIKPYCPWCHQAEAWLKGRGLNHEVLDVISHPEYRAQMYALSGQTLAPVIEVDGHVLADFDTDQLERWWRQQGWD